MNKHRHLIAILFCATPLFAQDDGYLQEASKRISSLVGSTWSERSMQNETQKIFVELVEPLGQSRIAVFDLPSKITDLTTAGKKKLQMAISEESLRRILFGLNTVNWKQLPSNDPFVVGLDGSFVYMEVHFGNVHWRGWRWNYYAAYGFINDRSGKQYKTPTMSGDKIQKKPDSENCLSLFFALILEALGTEEIK